MVNLNYRLNVFAAGDGKGEKNLALKDQSAAIEYIRKHIGGFGGDPVRIHVLGRRKQADLETSAGKIDHCWRKCRRSICPCSDVDRSAGQAMHSAVGNALVIAASA